MLRLNYIIFCLASVLLISCSHSDDHDRITQLTSQGTVVRKGKVIAWFPKDSLQQERMTHIVDSLNLGITLAQQFIGSQPEWQQFADSAIQYYFFPENFISHTTDKAQILIPFSRIKNSKAPWLHETMHILLRSKKGNWNEASTINVYFNRPLWLAEGLADYAAFSISNTHHIPVFDIQRIGGYLGMDSVCASRITNEKGQKVLEHIGDEGLMRELFGDNRRDYAPTFYGCSCSFTKYLAEKYGLQNLINANTEFDAEHATIESYTGKTIKQLKQEWVENLRMFSKTELSQ